MKKIQNKALRFALNKTNPYTKNHQDTTWNHKIYPINYLLFIKSSDTINKVNLEEHETFHNIVEKYEIEKIKIGPQKYCKGESTSQDVYKELQYFIYSCFIYVCIFERVLLFILCEKKRRKTIV